MVACSGAKCCGAVNSAWPVKKASASRPAICCRVLLIFRDASSRAAVNSFIAIWDGLLERGLFLPIESSGITRSIVSGKATSTSPTRTIPLVQIAVMLAFFASVLSTASIAESVTDGLELFG